MRAAEATRPKNEVSATARLARSINLGFFPLLFPISGEVGLEKVLAFIAKLCLRGEPLALAIDKGRELGLLKGLNGDLVYSKAREFLIYYHSLSGSPRERAEKFLRGMGRPAFPEWAEQRIPRLRLEAEASIRRNYWFWVNPFKGDQDKTLREIGEKIEFERDNDFPELYRVTKGDPSKVKAFKEGKAVIQDKASFAVVKALDPKPGELIYDMASAPGVKTALIMALTEGRAEVVASELYRTRLEKELSFLKSLNVDLRKVHLVQADSRNPLIRRADKVLLDAPCSSSGMVPNDPCVLLTLTPEKVKSFSELQREMLRTAVEISNYVTYSSCSVFPEEGEELVEGFKTLRLSFGEPSGNGVRFWPSQGTQGFFISVITGRKG